MFLSGCPVERVVTPYSSYEPILADRSSLNSISYSSSKPIIKTGKIYAYKKYIFINEPDKGYHVIDNSDPSKPSAVGYIAIVGSHDIAIQNDILYTDNATDLLSIDITDVTKPRLVRRTINIFPDQAPPDNLPLPDEYSAKYRPANTIVVEWRKRK